MDIKQLKPHDWVIIGAGIVMLTLGVALDWVRVSADAGSGGGNGPFDYFFTGGIAWLLVIAASVLVFLVVGKVIDEQAAPWNLIFVAATALATVLMLVRLILGVDEGVSVPGLSISRGPGLYVAFIAAAGALGGAVWRFVSTGGDLKDLTDVNKIKGGFSKSDS